jgi:hypothetical protein
MEKFEDSLALSRWTFSLLEELAYVYFDLV